MAKKKKKKLRTRKPKPSSEKKPRRSGPAVIPSRSLPGISPTAMLKDGEPLMPAKMSEILLEVAQPALDALPDNPSLEEYHRALLVAAMAWNVSRFDDLAEREREIRRFAEAAKLDDPQDRKDMREVLTFLAERAVLLWPDVEAFAAGVEVYEDETGDLRVMAMAHVPT